MSQFNIAQAKAQFSELVRKALAGEEVIIARDNEPLLKLVPLRTALGKRKPGSAKGKLVSLAKDFDEIPEGFKEYS
ncbi:MAG: type II toxin-antitoxin system Phd/YefM family antitoxin [Burkholderiales bacterium]